MIGLRLVGMDFLGIWLQNVKITVIEAVVMLIWFIRTHPKNIEAWSNSSKNQRMSKARRSLLKLC